MNLDANYIAIEQLKTKGNIGHFRTLKDKIKKQKEKTLICSSFFAKRRRKKNTLCIAVYIHE